MKKNRYKIRCLELKKTRSYIDYIYNMTRVFFVGHRYFHNTIDKMFCNVRFEWYVIIRLNQKSIAHRFMVLKSCCFVSNFLITFFKQCFKICVNYYRMTLCFFPPASPFNLYLYCCPSNDVKHRLQKIVCPLCLVFCERMSLEKFEIHVRIISFKNFYLVKRCRERKIRKIIPSFVFKIIFTNISFIFSCNMPSKNCPFEALHVQVLREDPTIGVYLYTPNIKPSMHCKVKPLPLLEYSVCSVINFVNASSTISCTPVSVKIALAAVLKARFSDEYSTCGILYVTVRFEEDEISTNPGDCTRFKRAFFAMIADFVLAKETRFSFSPVSPRFSTVVRTSIHSSSPRLPKNSSIALSCSVDRGVVWIFRTVNMLSFWVVGPGFMEDAPAGMLGTKMCGAI
ncbi:hypothetical protein AGLY_013840 [Aphis glycines]|uniref:Uncharacterized protein n=1 Tax=Aphis glycines TaxID=307491 RepID=A0A6G0T7C4_APHGL|nr:hypothetical protein AGLY_013840 [Aphis glycines]